MTRRRKQKMEREEEGDVVGRMTGTRVGVD